MPTHSLCAPIGRYTLIAFLALGVPHVALADPADGRHGIFAFLDMDADGRVMRSELRGTSVLPLFSIMNENGDGHVTIEEFERNAPGWLHGPRSGVGPDRLAVDGVVRPTSYPTP